MVSGLVIVEHGAEELLRIGWPKRGVSFRREGRPPRMSADVSLSLQLRELGELYTQNPNLKQTDSSSSQGGIPTQN